MTAEQRNDYDRRIGALEEAVFGEGGNDGIKTSLVKLSKDVDFIRERLSTRDAIGTKLLIGVIVAATGAGLSFVANLIFFALQFVRFGAGG